MKEEPNIANFHRVSLMFDGKEICGITVELERPKNSEEMKALFSQCVASFDAPSEPFEDLEKL